MGAQARATSAAVHGAGSGDTPQCAPFCVAEAQFCARFMCAAYAGKDREDPLIKLYPVPLGFKTKYFEDSVTDTEATVSVSEADGIVIVAFRGTESLQDVLTDARFLKVNLPCKRRRCQVTDTSLTRVLVPLP